MIEHTKETMNETLEGSIEHITYQNETNGYCVLQVKCPGERDLVTVIGNAATISPGEWLVCHGQWTNHPKFGEQFQARQMSNQPPNSLAGIERFLSSGLIKGVGAHFAKQLVQKFQHRVFDVIENEPQQLEQLPGIGPQRRKQITMAWETQKAIRDIMIFLHQHGMGSARAVRIYKTYGDSAIANIRENPYRLTRDIWGIGFKTADELAMSLGIAVDAMIRARAGLTHVLFEISAQGHCAAKAPYLLQEAEKLLCIPTPVLTQALELELAENLVEHEGHVFLRKLYEAELGIARHVERLGRGHPAWFATGKKTVETDLPDPTVGTDAVLAEAQQKTAITLSHSQKEAVLGALKSKLFIITGGPGVGKTTIINCILAVLRLRIQDIHLCAPTGRAAKRLSESTGMEAKTIHRLLEFDPALQSFHYRARLPLTANLLVVDECSMVDAHLMFSLLDALPDRCAVLFVGDVDQLPSVGPGNVLHDLIHCGRIATAKLTEIYRQAAQSHIIQNAHRINQGLAPLANGGDDRDFYMIETEDEQAIQEKIIRMIHERIPLRFNLDPADVQVLTPTNRGGLGTRSLNKLLQAHFIKDDKNGVQKYSNHYYPGDKVIQLVNNYDKDIFNGDIGVIRSVDGEEQTVLIDFDGYPVSYGFHELDEINLAYAITIHKSQGSEYPAVIIPLASTHYTMLERNLLYTAVTRGKKLVVLIGQKRAVMMAVQRNRARRRITFLAKHLA